MNETIAQYTARIAAFAEGKDPIAVQHRTYETLAGFVEGATAELLDRQRAPGKWSMRQILAHLADVEVVNTWRYRQMLEHSGVALDAFDQDEWARLGDYRVRDPDESLVIFRRLRDNNLRLFAKLTEEEWQKYGMHAERGKMTVRDLTGQIAGHDLNHIAQLREIVGNG